MRAELGVFEEWIGEDRLGLKEVLIETPPKADALGTQRGRRVWIEPGLGTFWTRRVLRHELCHALDWEERLAERVEDVAAFNARTFDPLLFGDGYDYPGNDVSEVIARVCEAGPTTLYALIDPCPFEDPAIAQVASWVSSVMYTEAVPPSETTLPVDNWTTWNAPNGVSDLVVIGSGDPDAVLIRGRDGAETREWYVDARTATAIEPVFANVDAEPEAWAFDGPEFVAGGSIVGARRPGVLSTLLIGVSTEPRLVEGNDDGLAFPEVHVCLPGADIAFWGPSGEVVRVVRRHSDAASWATLDLGNP